MPEVGDRIKKLRFGLGLKQVQFAPQARVSQGYLAELETGKKRPSSRVLLAISNAFGVEEEWLNSGRGKKTTTERMTLTMEERDVVTLYRRLRPNDQVTVLKQMKSTN